MPNKIFLERREGVDVSSLAQPSALLERLRPPLPLAPLQPVLRRIVTHVARTHPEIFERLGPHAAKRFLIDPVDLPFVLLLRPDPYRPRLTAHRRDIVIDSQAMISGRFFKLFDMIDGALDGDALFFTRDLKVGGDIEAVVALRNAIDDADEDMASAIAGAFGPLREPLLALLKLARGFGKEQPDEQD